MRRFVYRHLGMVLYFVMFFFGAYVLWYGMDQHLFAAPQPGLDQHSILNCALGLAKGELPAGHYRYSYSYTVFLTLLALVSGGKLWLMRLLQLAVASLIPAVVCRTARLCRTGRTAAFAGGLLCCASAPLVLISLDFLRAAPLALAFVSMLYFLLAAEFRRGRGEKKAHLSAAAAGVCGALCVLGRENFLAVVCWVPLLLWSVRDRRGAAVFCGTLILPLAVVIVFNGIFYHSFQLVPGNVGNILGFYGGETGEVRNVRNVLLSVPRHLWDMASSFELDNSLSVYAHREIVTPLKILCLPFNLLWMLGAAGAFLNRRERGTKWAAVLAAAYIASMLFFTVFYRFRVPVIPLLAVLAAGAFRNFAAMWRRHRRRMLAAAAAGMAALFLLTWVDPDTRRTAEERNGVAYVLIANRRISEAKKYLDDMTGRGQDSRNGRLVLVQCLVDDRRFAEAETYLEEVSSAGFDAAVGWYYLAVKLHEAGDISGANRAFLRMKTLFNRN